MEQLKHLDRPLAEHLSIIRSEIDQAKRYPYVYAYPPKGAYRPFVDHAAVRRAWEGYAGPLSTYVHVPFCDIKCSFCTLFTTVGQPRERLVRYVDCLVREFELVGTGMAGAAVTVESVYFGGGTPGVLTTDELGRVLSHISHAF